MDGFIAFGPIPGCRGAASCRPPRSWPLGRHSGRVPAWPSPPPRLLQWIRHYGHPAIPGRVARSRDGAEGFAWDRLPGPGGGSRVPAPGRIGAVARGSAYFVIECSHNFVLVIRRIVRERIAVI